MPADGRAALLKNLRVFERSKWLAVMNNFGTACAAAAVVGLAWQSIGQSIPVGENGFVTLPILMGVFATARLVRQPRETSWSNGSNRHALTAASAFIGVFVTLVVAAATPLRGNRPRFFGHPHVDLGAVTFASIVVWAIAWPVMQIVFGAVYRRRERLAVVGLSMEEEGETGIAIVNAFVSVVVSGLLACADAAALSAGVVEASAGIALGIAVSMIVDRRERLRTGAIDRARHETGNGLRVETGASSNRLVLPSDREGTFRTSDRDAVLVTTLDPDGRATFGDLHAR